MVKLFLAGCSCQWRSFLLAHGIWKPAGEDEGGEKQLGIQCSLLVGKNLVNRLDLVPHPTLYNKEVFGGCNKKDGL